jgi:hypothetical protein
MNAVLRVLIATAAATAAATSHAVLVVNYEFNDPAGPLSSAVNSGSGTIAPWGDDTDATLNGAGQLVVSGPLGFQARALTGLSAISSGTAFLRVDFDSWGASTDPFFVFGMRASGPSTGNQSWRLQFSSGDASDGDPTGRLFEVTANSFNGGFNSLAGNIPVESELNGFSVIMGINLDNDTTSVWWDPDRTGNYEIVGGRENVAIDSSNGFTDFNLVDAIQLQSNGGLFAIDRLAFGTSFAEIAAIPEPSLFAAFGVISFALISASRRGSLRTE